MTLFIREAAGSDWLPVRDLLKKFHKVAPYAPIEYNEPDAKRMFITSASSKKVLSLVVADKKHNIHGLCIATIQLSWWGARTAIELITYCEVPGWQHKLLRLYKKWAKNNNADVVTLVNSNGCNERYNRLANIHGFKQIGSVFMLDEKEKM